ncbi:MAG: glycosyltransferase family 4 protein [Verrucomicrobiales bacterium]|nr:glycosyltransferase family 4 protein [Verrucomicrobiales bacterium]
MKLLFTTSTGRTGIGGHLYTVRAHTQALQAHADCVVVGVGAARSPALDTLAGRLHYVGYTSDRSRLRELRHFLALVRAERPDVIHAFDTTSYAFARCAARRVGTGLILTICGGQNPTARYPSQFVPRVDRLVLFSEENERFFRGQRRFSRTMIWRIPNRVNEVSCDPEKVARLRGRLERNKPVLLRVGRLGLFHEKTAMQCIRLSERLNAAGHPVQLVLLGHAQNPGVRERLAAALGPHGVIISDPDFVRMGSAVLDAGDVVVGTGRSFMEAAARGRVLLAPVHAGVLPALVTEANWLSLFHANFSGRCVPNGWDEAANFEAIRQVLTDHDCRARLGAFSRSLFEKHFSLESVIDQYLQIYRESRPPQGWDWYDLAKHWFWLVWHSRRVRGSFSPAGSGEADVVD